MTLSLEQEIELSLRRGAELSKRWSKDAAKENVQAADMVAAAQFLLLYSSEQHPEVYKIITTAIMAINKKRKENNGKSRND